MEPLVGRTPLPDKPATPELAPGYKGESPLALKRLKVLYEKQKTKGSNCKDRPEEFIDFEEWPTVTEAAELCFGCPVRIECLQYVESTHNVWGVWAGRVYGREEEDGSV